MKKIIDNFSRQSFTYKKYRPTYPTELYDDMLSYVKNKENCWDCATGNGQVAVELSKHFKQVFATDISKNQLDQAEQKENIHYSIQRAEQTNFSDHQFDLITVGQAVHWFDFKAFNKEIKRVAKKDGIICIWGYDLLKITPAIDRLIDTFYKDVVGPYWNEERKHIEDKYSSIIFDFEEIQINKNKEIITNWELSDLSGYLNSWSSVQNFMSKNGGENPVDELIVRITENWDSSVKREVRFPIFMRCGRC